MRFLRNDKSWQYQFQYQKSISKINFNIKNQFFKPQIAQIGTNLKLKNYFSNFSAIGSIAYCLLPNAFQQKVN